MLRNGDLAGESELSGRRRGTGTASQQRPLSAALGTACIYRRAFVGLYLLGVGVPASVSVAALVQNGCGCLTPCSPFTPLNNVKFL